MQTMLQLIMASGEQSGSDIATSTVTTATDGNHRNAPVAFRNAIVVNQATETLIETVNRSFITAGGDQGMQLRNEITFLVDAAAIRLRRPPPPSPYVSPRAVHSRYRSVLVQ